MISVPWEDLMSWAKAIAAGSSPLSISVWAMPTAPVWCSSIICSHMRSNSTPLAASREDMSSALIIPPMAEWSMPGMALAALSAPQVSSQPFRVSISGPWAAWMRAARSATSGSVERSATRSAISTACSWCGIIPWANSTSASLNVASAGTDVEDSDVAVSEPPEQADRATEPAIRAPTSAVLRGERRNVGSLNTGTPEGCDARAWPGREG
ncbi:hypothetical protein GCM10023162_03220 [Klenkia terrae]